MKTQFPAVLFVRLRPALRRTALRRPIPVLSDLGRTGRLRTLPLVGELVVK